MAKTTNIFQPKGYTIGAAYITPTETTTSVLVATPSVDDSICKSILITSTDSVSRDVKIILKSGSNEYLLGTVAVPAGAGNISGTPTVDGLSVIGLPKDRVEKPVLPLQGGVEIYAKSSATVTASTQITITAILENF